MKSAGWWRPLFLAWLIASIATAAALFLGEVMGKTPCVLCWYQRIAMFPMVVILGIGLCEPDGRGVRYAWPFASVGFGLALYHCLVFWDVLDEALVPCGSSSSCASADVQVAGGLPIPLLSLIAFAAILGLMWLTRRKEMA